MSSIISIQEWVKAARAGEDAAWNVVYKQYFPGAYATALRICGNTPVARDAVQDAFITAYLKLEQLKDVAAFGGWIKKIVIRNCYRALHNQPANEYLEILPHRADSCWEDEINRKFDELSTQNRLSASIADLPEMLRSTLLLRYFSNFHSYEEIAAILCVPVGTVRSRLNQARIKLVEYWRTRQDAAENVSHECEEWNNFYHSVFTGIHRHDESKNLFMKHLQKDMQVIFARNKMGIGSWQVEKLVMDDRRVGSWFRPANVQSSGNISFVEVNHFNSPEYPDRCPESTICVLYRDNGKVAKMNLHLAYR